MTSLHTVEEENEKVKCAELLSKSKISIEKIAVSWATHRHNDQWLFMIEKLAKIQKQIDDLEHEVRWL